MNRQARLVTTENWHSYGRVSFFEAIKAEAILLSRRNSLCDWTWLIECRCESEPDVIDKYSVQVTPHAEVLNPRKGM